MNPDISRSCHGYFFFSENGKWSLMFQNIFQWLAVCCFRSIFTNIMIKCKLLLEMILHILMKLNFDYNEYIYIWLIENVDFVSFRFISISFIKNSSYDIDIQGIMSLFYFNIIIIQKSENLCDRSWNKNENLMTRHNFIDILNWVIITSTIILL